MFFGPRLLLLPFTSRLYDGLSLNSLIVWLLGILIISSLLRFNLSMTGFDGWLLLISALPALCFNIHSVAENWLVLHPLWVRHSW